MATKPATSLIWLPDSRRWAPTSRFLLLVYSVCGCEENDDPKYLNDLVGNGSYAALNKTLVTVSDVNNTRTLIINGTLPNGTTAPGGVDDAGVALGVSKYAGYWAMGLVVLYGVML
jgi:hypothetical protein